MVMAKNTIDGKTYKKDGCFYKRSRKQNAVPIGILMRDISTGASVQFLPETILEEVVILDEVAIEAKILLNKAESLEYDDYIKFHRWLNKEGMVRVANHAPPKTELEKCCDEIIAAMPGWSYVDPKIQGIIAKYMEAK